MTAHFRCTHAVLAALLLIPGVALAQQECFEALANSPTFENRPTPASAETLLDELLFQRASQTYLWAMPLINTMGMKVGSEEKFGAGYHVLPVWKKRLSAKTLITTPNSDVIYAMSYVDLGKDGPLVFDAPPLVQGILLDAWQRPIPGPKSEGGGETKWVVPDKFFDQLGTVAPLPGEEALYGQFRVLLDAAAKDPAIKHALVEAAVETEREVIEPFLAWKRNGRPAGNGWNRSTNNARFGHDYYNRTGTAKSNMFDNKPTETQYFYTDDDSAGARLDGTKSYEVTFAPGQEPPVSGFWSMTLYNNEHFFHPNPLKRYLLGTKNTHLRKGTDGSLTLYVGAQSPGADKESNWLPAPTGHFSLYIRAYWGQQGILDGSWQPPVIRQVK